MAKPVGAVTRGTTHPNRLRRIDRWLTGTQRSRLTAGSPLVVDLGYGASPVTTVEFAERLRSVNPRIHVVGIEIEPDRVAAGQAVAGPGVEFIRGGFEVPVPGLVRVVRAANVLRQYAESEVPEAWRLLQSRLDDSGLVIDATCSELGRRATWVALDRDRPLSLTVSVALHDIDRPSDVAERLPKSLIHRNVPGERVYDWLAALDEAWAREAPLAAYGRRQRFVAMADHVKQLGWPVLDGPARWRLGEISVAWDAVAPRR